VLTCLVDEEIIASSEATDEITFISELLLSCSSCLKTGSSRASLWVVATNFENQPNKSSITNKELLQLKRLEIEERDKEREAQYCLKELELRGKKLNFQLKLKKLEAKVDRSIKGATETGAGYPSIY